ncbi:XTP/dITP diphosphatase [Gemella haemolysans]|jgi:non-canonical purine NTP pyrophosphatase, rdgB/HAM1 family|uniref:dITP/XTP pyrophosphatase n=2 Tax=Gemella haemolysans TaxID=1379 RepID=A0AA87DQX4_9BACL|nr:XTP/dITP diphosphatase [Gemella haemolysans]EGF87336.1 rdgB/HAM1 family non-canonical purine NTP pyrophosphatase [Gemella haemolysans M341]QIX87931.1 XTP/dITP diphosphatase [Gemella haemolysans]
MKELILASNNAHKVEEIKSILEDYNILTLKDINYTEEIVEDGSTFEENALIKARTISKYSGKTAISDDSGLSVDLLDGRPGVYSARYSKEQTDEKNIEKVLLELNGQKSKAKFVSVIALVKPDGTELTFRGECHGEIIFEKRGTNGFGYDPIFYVPSLDKTFAELSAEQKNSISHRKQSLEKFSQYLKEESDEN